MLQIFVRPRDTNLEPMIQFYEKTSLSHGWYVVVGPENSDAPLKVRQNVFILDAHPKKGDQLKIPDYDGMQPCQWLVQLVGCRNKE